LGLSCGIGGSLWGINGGEHVSVFDRSIRKVTVDSASYFAKGGEEHRILDAMMLHYHRAFTRPFFHYKKRGRNSGRVDGIKKG
jgi:hypothetical protein